MEFTSFSAQSCIQWTLLDGNSGKGVQNHSPAFKVKKTITILLLHLGWDAWICLPSPIYELSISSHTMDSSIVNLTKSWDGKKRPPTPLLGKNSNFTQKNLLSLKQFVSYSGGFHGLFICLGGGWCWWCWLGNKKQLTKRKKNKKIKKSAKYTLQSL